MRTLTGDAYSAMFRGAICLQPYSRQDFADRVSGVTLDAFVAGAPVVALSGTWIARMVQRFKAGEVIEEPTAWLDKWRLTSPVRTIEYYADTT